MKTFCIKIRFIYKYMYIQFNTCCSKYYVTCMNILCDWVPKQWKVNCMLVGNCILLILPIFIPVSKPVWQWCHSLEPSGLKFFKLKMYMKSNVYVCYVKLRFEKQSTILRSNCNLVYHKQKQGRIHQIEYAMEAVKQGSATVGLKSKSHAILVALKVCL